MKARVDKDTCIGCGLCESVCPRVFRITEDGKAEASPEKLNPELEKEAREAADQCPVEAITVEEE